MVAGQDVKNPVVQRRILVINPNTSASVTASVLRLCRQSYPELSWDGATSRLGASYISSEAAYAIAAHAVLETYADHYDAHDAVLIACFGDPGLLALRELAAVPVAGLAHASFVAAAAQGRFAVVTGGKAWEPMLRRFARLHQLDDRLVAVHAVDLTGAEIAAAPDEAMQALCSVARQGVADGAQVVLLGGAALGGLATQLQQWIEVPVLDNVLLAALAAVQSVGLRAPASGTARPARPAGVEVRGTGGALALLMGGSETILRP